MNTKGFAETNIETPNDVSITEKPLNPSDNTKKRVDINILKSKLKRDEDKEFRKNLLIFIFFLAMIGSIGIYFSL